MLVLQAKELMIMRAKEYAKSGDFADSMSIEIALNGEFPKVRQWLSRFARQELDEMCRQTLDHEPAVLNPAKE